MPNADNTSLPIGSYIYRMCSKSLLLLSAKNAQLAFELSTSDKASPTPHLSAFETLKTTLEQAKSITNTDLEIMLSVGGIRILNVASISLDVLWFEAIFDDIKDTRDGSEGHCGIVGLKRPPNSPREDYRKMRVKLADMARDYWKSKGLLWD